MYTSYLFTLLFVGMVITSALCMVLSGPSAIAVLTLYELFQSGIFPLIYAICLRGLGNHTKTGAVFLTVATSGGAVFPAIQNPLAASYGQRYSFCIVLAASAGGIVFPAFLETVDKAKRQVDPRITERTLPTTRSEGNGGRRGRSFSEKALWKFRRKSIREVEFQHTEKRVDPSNI